MAMATLTIAGCSQNEIVETAQPGNEAVGFSVYSGVHTRAAVTDYAAIKDVAAGFGVVAISSASGNPLHMKDTHVTYSGSSWGYTPAVYWPTEGSSLSFYAFAPYNGAGISKGASSADFESTTAPSVTLTLQAPKKMVDLVAAKAEGKTSEDGAVSLKFAHVLSRVALKAHTSVDDASTTVKVTGLKILGATSNNTSSLLYSEAKYNIKTDAWDLLGGTKQGDDWTIIADGESEDTYPAIAVTNTAASILGENEYLFLIPVGSGDAPDAIKMELTYTVTTGGITTTTTKTLSFTSGSGFLQKGTAYAIDFEITLNAISFTVDETGWDWDSESTVTPAS